MTWLVVMLALAAPARPARASRVKHPQKFEPTLVKVPRDVGPGQVRFVTSDAVYLNRGSADGLAVAVGVGLARGGKTLTTCSVTQLSEHSAVCQTSAKNLIRVGDTVLTVRAAVPPGKPIEPLPSASSLEAERELLLGAPWSLVEFGEGGHTARSDGRRLRVRLEHHFWGDLGASDGTFQLEHIAASFHQRLGAGFSVSADASLLVWSQRSAKSRNPRITLIQPVVRQLEVTWAPSTLPVIVRLGRVRPHAVPGLLALDGAQLGYVNEHTELGVYGGLLPDAITTGISPGQFAAGAYGLGRLVNGKGAAASVFQAEARAGWAVRPNLGSRFEAGASLHGWVSRLLDAHVGTQFALAPAHQTPASLDLATLDVGLVPNDTLRFRLSARYRGSALLEAVPTGVTLPTTRSLHASTDGSFDLSPALTVTVRAGVAWEIQGDLAQAFFGPEVAWRPWSGRLGLSAAYQEEVGWLRGRTFSLAATIAPTTGFRLYLRGAWFQQPTPTLGSNELSTSLGVDARLTSFLVGRLSGSWRTGLPGPVQLLSRSAAQATLQLAVEL